MSKVDPTPTILGKPVLPTTSSNTAEAAIAFAEAGAQVKQAKADIPTTRLNANIPVELHRALKIRAASEGKTIGQLVEDWIKSWAVK